VCEEKSFQCVSAHRRHRSCHRSIIIVHATSNIHFRFKSFPRVEHCQTGCAVDGCTSVWVHVRVGMWVCRCMVVWLYECMNVWVYGCISVWLYGFGCVEVWLCGNMIMGV